MINFESVNKTETILNKTKLFASQQELKNVKL